jgi:hypothetical protein
MSIRLTTRQTQQRWGNVLVRHQIQLPTANVGRLVNSAADFMEALDGQVVPHGKN